MKLYTFRTVTVRLFIIKSLFTAFEHDQDGTAVPSWSWPLTLSIKINKLWPLATYNLYVDKILSRPSKTGRL